MGGRAGYDVVRSTANGVLHCRQDRTTSIPGNLGECDRSIGAMKPPNRREREGIVERPSEAPVRI